MKLSVLLLLFCVGTASLAFGTTVTVSPDGSGDFPTIQAAVDAAASGDVLELLDGTFTGEGNRNIEFGSKSLTIRSQSGNPTTCVIDCGGHGRAMRIYRVPAPGALLQGLTLHDGYDYDHGGGIYSGLSNLTVENCVFTEHAASSGGAIYFYTGTLTLSGCHFESNVTAIGGSTAYRGAAVACGGAQVTASNCTFYSNFAVTGGGLSLSDNCTATLTGCVFIWNGIDSGGGIYCSRSSLMVETCTFEVSPILLTIGSVGELSNTILTHAYDGSAGITCQGGTSTANLSCCDLYHNEGGDWVGCIASQAGMNGNLSVDPLYCDYSEFILTLRADSPCAQENNPVCGQIGALPVGCGPTPAVPMTWGRLKALFRGQADGR